MAADKVRAWGAKVTHAEVQSPPGPIRFRARLLADGTVPICSRMPRWLQLSKTPSGLTEFDN